MKKKPLFKWAFFSVLILFVGVIVTVAVLSHMQKKDFRKVRKPMKAVLLGK
jgi:hypothetical protein